MGTTRATSAVLNDPLFVDAHLTIDNDPASWNLAVTGALAETSTVVFNGRAITAASDADNNTAAEALRVALVADADLLAKCTVAIAANEITVASRDRFSEQTIYSSGSGAADVVATPNTNLAADHSATLAEAFITPDGSTVWMLYEIEMMITDAAIVAAEFGGLAAALTNGIHMGVATGATNTFIRSITGSRNLETNADLHGLGFDVSVRAEGAGNETLVAKLDLSNAPITLFGSDADKLFMTMEDNLSGLVDFRVRVRGFRASTYENVLSQFQRWCSLGR